VLRRTNSVLVPYAFVPIEVVMTRRNRIDSADSAVRVMVGITREIQPPSHVPLDDCDWPFWHSVIAEFARSEWTEHQLELAAMLARDMANLERNQRQLRSEGEVMATERGTPVVNPRKAVVQATQSGILSMRRSLSLHARAQGGEARDVGKRSAAAKAIEAGGIEDDLIARPVFQ